MSRKRANLDQAQVDKYFEVEPRRIKTPYDRKYPAHSYRLTDAMHENLKRIAAEAGVPLSDLVRWVFQQFIEGYDDGTVELPVEQYVTSVSRLT